MEHETQVFLLVIKTQLTDPSVLTMICRKLRKRLIHSFKTMTPKNTIEIRRTPADRRFALYSIRIRDRNPDKSICVSIMVERWFKYETLWKWGEIFHASTDQNYVVSQLQFANEQSLARRVTFVNKWTPKRQFSDEESWSRFMQEAFPNHGWKQTKLTDSW
jgi:hypothetical protein